jgi:ABC-2 type transport system ATP-binding protein
MHISLENVSKSYLLTRALDSVTLDISPGQIVAIVGANGAGKTTLLRCLAGLTVPTRGRVLYDGQPFSRTRVDLRRRLCFLPDTPYVVPTMTVARHIGLVLEAYQITSPGIEDTVLKLLHEFALVSHVESRLSELSKGELYKTGLVAFLAVDADLWIFDEPFASGMDPPALAAFRTHVHDATRRGRTVIYTTQIVELAERLSDSVLVLREGKNHRLLSTEELRSGSQDNAALERIFRDLHEESGE